MTGRGGWMAHHPVSGKLTHVVTKAWFDEVKADLYEAEYKLTDAQRELADARARGDEWRIKEDLAQREIERLREALGRIALEANYADMVEIASEALAVDRTKPELGTVDE